MKLRNLVLLAVLLLVPFGFTAKAQSGPPTPPPSAVWGGFATLSAGTSTTNTALPVSSTTYPVVAVTNTGANDAWVKAGATNTIAATTTSVYVPAGTTVAFWAGSGNAFIAGITFSGTSVLNIQQWTGAPTLARATAGQPAGAVALYHTQTQISSAQILALNSTPVLLVAGIPGHIIVPVTTSFQLNFNSIAYTGGAGLNVGYIVAGTVVGVSTGPVLGVRASAYTYSVAGPFAAQITATVIGQPLALGTTAAFLAGDSTLTVDVWYELV